MIEQECKGGLNQFVTECAIKAVYIPYAEGSIAKKDIDVMIDAIAVHYASMGEWKIYEHPLLWRRRYKINSAKRAVRKMFKTQA